MTSKIAISLPDELVAQAREAVDRGAAASVSAYVASALREAGSRETRTDVLDAWEAELGVPSAGARGWARRAAPRRRVKGLTLDSGALISLERGDERVRALLRAAVDQQREVHVVVGVIVQVWRRGDRQVRIARLLRADGVTPQLGRPTPPVRSVGCAAAAVTTTWSRSMSPCMRGSTTTSW